MYGDLFCYSPYNKGKEYNDNKDRDNYNIHFYFLP